MEFNGLPLHPLVVHAAVVFGPLAALAALVYAVPRWRDRMRWPMLGLALVATGAISAAYLSGDDLLENNPALGSLPAVQTHEDRAGILIWVILGFGVVAILTAALHDRRGLVRGGLTALLVVGAVAVLIWTALTGDAGSRAVWGGV